MDNYNKINANNLETAVIQYVGDLSYEIEQTPTDVIGFYTGVGEVALMAAAHEEILANGDDKGLEALLVNSIGGEVFFDKIMQDYEPNSQIYQEAEQLKSLMGDIYTKVSDKLGVDYDKSQIVAEMSNAMPDNVVVSDELAGAIIGLPAYAMQAQMVNNAVSQGSSVGEIFNGNQDALLMNAFMANAYVGIINATLDAHGNQPGVREALEPAAYAIGTYAITLNSTIGYGSSNGYLN